MMNCNLKRAGYLLVFVISLFFFWNHSSATAEAATPSFLEKEIEISGTGETYQLKIINKKANSKYRWSSLDGTVAKVSSSGMVYSINKGTTKIKCKITYATGKTKNLYCIVKVTIPATGIKINNVEKVNGAHVMKVGETYNFNRTLTPENASDKTYWYLDSSDQDSNPEAVRVNSSNGIVTAVRRGKIVLIATAVRDFSVEAAEESDVKDAVIIEVEGPSSEVVSARITNSKTIRVEFGTAIRESTIISATGKITSNIAVTPLEDSKGSKAKDPGTLTAALFSDGKTMTITASNSFNGNYNITLTNGVLTTKGESIYRYEKELSFEDGTASDTSDDSDNAGTDQTAVDINNPEVASITLDDDGMTTVITFTEAMDFSNFKVIDVNEASGSSTAQASTISFLKNVLNYSFGSDKKTMAINLSAISTTDYNKIFRITMSGITDAAGNGLVNQSLVANIRTDTTPREQARPVTVIRTSYDTITAIFTRSIRTPGFAYINHSGYYNGEVDSEDDHRVNYKIASYQASLTGIQTVSIGHWNSYNVISTDAYANTMYDFTVNFTTENVKPVLISYDYNADLNVLKLTYSEDVSLSVQTGMLDYTMVSNQVSDYRGFLNYSKLSTTNHVVEIMLTNITLYGEYTFTLPEGFVMDGYKNLSDSRIITIHNKSEAEVINQLAEPYSVYQSEVNYSFIFIEFADKLDIATALDADHYSVASTTVEEVKLIRNDSDGATVRLTLKKGSIKSSGNRKVAVSGIKGYNGSYSEMKSYYVQVNLIENVDPQLKSVVFDKETKNSINLKFTEEIKGSMTVTVKERSTGNMVGGTAAVSGDTVTITLFGTPNDGTYLDIYIQQNFITDLSGNESTLSPVIKVFANY